MKQGILTLILWIIAISFCLCQDPIGVDKKQQDEIEQLKKQVADLKNEISTLKAVLKNDVEQARTNQNTKIATNRRNLEVQIQNQDSVFAEKMEVIKVEVADALKKNEDKIKKAIAKTDNLLPVGTIVAFHLAESGIPSNWVKCDGRKIADPNSIYNGYNVPNLVGYFIRGKTSKESIGDKGGSDTSPSHAHSISNHTHEVGSHTHNFATDMTSLGYLNCQNPSYGLACVSGNGDAQYFIAASTESQIKAMTNHNHVGTTGNASSGYTGSSGGGTTGAGGGGSNIPEYKAFNYIIKIK